MDPRFIPTSNDPWAVATSYLIAAFASYVAIDLSRRVRDRDGRLVARWWAAGAFAMGTGVWSMHFMAMLGFEAGIVIGFAPGKTLLSWLAAVLAGSIALAVGARARLTRRALVLATGPIATAILAMHYLGMAAAELVPGIAWDWPIVAASAGVALGTAAAALLIFFRLRDPQLAGRWTLQLGAALVMGLAIAAVHFTGMAAVRMPLGSVCISGDGLRGFGLQALTGTLTFVLLGAVLLTSIADARRRSEGRLRSSLQAADARLQRLAFVDALTGLPNRALFYDRLEHAGAQHVGPSGASGGNASTPRVAVLFVDLDGFKPINDAYGRTTGDTLLREAASRLQQCARAGDTVARIASDEFVLLLEDEDAAAAALQMADRVLQALQQPFGGIGPGVSLSCSVGIALHPDHGAVDVLVERAEAAMVAAKRSGGGRWAVFEGRMAGDVAEQVALQQELRGALARGELSLHYQPKAHACSGAVNSVEALMRWQHPQRGWVSPAVFIPLAERFGLIGALGDWVIDEACAQIARWNADGRRCQVAINVSAQQLRQSELPARVASAIRRHGIDPLQLVLEITETAMMENIAAQGALLGELAAIGVRLSIDDFGTGYSSLAYLRRLPVHQLKLDLSLVQDIDRDADARAVLHAVVQLAHALRLEVVAEGVETAEQARILRSQGCDLLQGWHIARPMPAAQLLPWLEQHERDRGVRAPAVGTQSTAAATAQPA
ncbi:MAG TPA: EAL domain-containing protein [Rubrivivax sp.]|nr:EAL domain-containing protein [Rubrivivax sp.]